MDAKTPAARLRASCGRAYSGFVCDWRHRIGKVAEEDVERRANVGTDRSLAHVVLVGRGAVRVAQLIPGRIQADLVCDEGADGPAEVRDSGMRPLPRLDVWLYGQFENGA